MRSHASFKYATNLGSLGLTFMTAGILDAFTSASVILTILVDCH